MFVLDFSVKCKQLLPGINEGQLHVENIVLQSFSFKEQFLGAG